MKENVQSKKNRPQHPIGPVVLEARGITKRFPGVVALNDVNLRVCKGEVLALIGENGAGKSTLIKILSGVYNLDEGELAIDGAAIQFGGPGEATAAGIGIVHQELNYVSTVSVAENIFMGKMPKKGLLIDYKRMYAEATQIMAKIGAYIDPKMTIGKCSIAQKQLIEIAKVISDDTRVLILDEPTSALNDVETENLIEFVHTAAGMGIAVIYISHRLDEIFKIADRVMVLRDGQNVGEMDIADASKEKFITLMAGRSIQEMYPKQKTQVGQIALEVTGLKSRELHDVSFTARRGEVLGIYGLVGSGHQNIGSAVFGQDQVFAGQIKVDGQAVNVSSPSRAVQQGIAYVPAERKTEGLILGNSVQVNMMAAYYSFGSHFLVNRKKDKETAARWIKSFRIKTPSSETKIDSLSGGNQQKVVLSKWLELSPKILILNEPTRGIDVGAKVEIYRILDELCQKGLSIIMITSEMEELLTMSDRVLVMHTGRISGIAEGEEITQQNIIRYAMGGNI
ncbi:MAG: sugar ABC transporter ATP-binding protein [Oscillospiraceae bacterium]